MRRLLVAIVLVTACSGSLVDQFGVSSSSPSPPDAGIPGATVCGGTAQSCGAPGACVVCSGSTPTCDNAVCTPSCVAPLFSCGNGACCAPSQIAAGGNTTCAVIGNGVQCWGLLLGTGGQSSASPVQIATGLVSPSIAVGATHACLIDGGLVKCWGSNGAGELGVPASGGTASPAAPVPNVFDATQVAVGASHSCAVTPSGLFCWGANGSGQLGDAAAPSGAVFHVPLPASPSQVTAGDLHTCVKTAAGGVTCWGSDVHGQIGNGVTGAAPVAPTAVTLTSGGGGGGGGRGGGGGGAAPTAALVVAGPNHTCAIANVGGTQPVNELVECWGGNGSGQVGTGATLDQPSPFELTPVGFTALTAGGSHTCAYSVGAMPVPPEDGISTDAGVYCWGSNGSGQLGTGVTGPGTQQPPTSPILANANGGVDALAAGQNHTCARMHDGALLCWGDNSLGQAGQPGGGSVPSPKQVIAP
jgi:alpha-tubulin suppressor-like RCC1 family protein